jgi:ribonuclease HII
MLKLSYSGVFREAGCDEAGRGCLAGPVFAAAVVLREDFCDEELNDSKQLNVSKRNRLRMLIEDTADDWSVARVDASEIDQINILNASILAMHRALDGLKNKPELILVDGNRFKDYKAIRHLCMIGGDAIWMSIAAASVLAKTHRDEYMRQIHDEFPCYGWDHNAGYPTRCHRDALLKYGASPYHRKSFRLSEQLKLGF